MPRPRTTASGRLYCRQCGALATVSRDICNGCQMAEVRSHIKRRARPGDIEDQDVQVAYGQSLASLEDRRRAQAAMSPSRTAGAKVLEADDFASVIQSGVTGGFATEHKTLAYAAMFSVAMGKSRMNLGAAALFYSYGQKTFYRHVRAVMDALPGGRLTSRKRNSPSKHNERNPNRLLTQNVSIARALRLTRLYMHDEIIPLALKLGCSKTAIWNIESCNVVVQPHWVESWARVYGVSEESLWRYADAISEGPAAQGGARDLVCKFVAIVLKGCT